MRHAEDPLLAADRIVRAGLGVRDGQTIRDRARELWDDSRPRGYIIDDRPAQVRAAEAYLSAPDGWLGLQRAATILA